MICDTQKSVKNILAKACYIVFNISITSVKMGKPVIVRLSADFGALTSNSPCAEIIGSREGGKIIKKAEFVTLGFLIMKIVIFGAERRVIVG